MSNGTRTRDHLDHNQELYQLSYAHREERKSRARATGALSGASRPIALAGRTQFVVRPVATWPLNVVDSFVVDVTPT